MNVQPDLETERLILRPFNTNDSSQVQKLAGDREVAATTLLIPHPYKDGNAEKWIATHKPMFNIGKVYTFAVTLKENRILIGAIGLTVSKSNKRAELGYWIGKPFWNKGYCSEAARAMLKYGFEDLRLNRIFAHHMTSNPASGKVMEKIGMKYEGLLRQHVIKWDKFMDLKIYGIIAENYENEK